MQQLVLTHGSPRGSSRPLTPGTTGDSTWFLLMGPLSAHTPLRQWGQHLLACPTSVVVAHTLLGQLRQRLGPAFRSLGNDGVLCPPVEPTIGAAAHACTWSSASVGGVLLPKSMSVGKEAPYGSPVPLLVYPTTMAPCLSGGLRLLPSAPSVATLQPLQVVSAQPIPVLSLGLTSEACALAPSPLLHQWTSILGWRAQCSSIICAGHSLFCLPQTGCCDLL